MWTAFLWYSKKHILAMEKKVFSSFQYLQKYEFILKRDIIAPWWHIWGALYFCL